MAAKDGKQTKDFNAKECEGEDVCCRGEAGCENGGCHKSGICGERGWESIEGSGEVFGGWNEDGLEKNGGVRGLLDAYTTAVVKEKYINTHEPAAHGPDRIACGGFSERFKNWTETQKGAIDKNS